MARTSRDRFQAAKKAEQLGMPLGTANYRLRKAIIFAQAHGRMNRGVDGRIECYRCGGAITQPADLSIDHKEPWMDSANPVDLFFDLDNIAFSHLWCNIEARRR